MNRKGLLLAIIAAICLPACDESNRPTPELAAAQRALDENTGLWRRSNFQSYQYTFRRQCFCVPGEDIVVIVVNGQVSQAFRTPSGTYLTAQEVANLFTIEQLFNTVQEAIDQRVYKLTVTYNARLGFPESISIDRDRNLADEEISYLASNLQ